MNSLKSYWASIGRQRKEMPEAELPRLAKAGVANRLARSKSGEKKARLRVFPNPRSGIRFVLYAGSWFIRAQTWDRLVFRAAFGPWTRLPVAFNKNRRST